MACEVKGFKPEDYMDPKEARRRDRFEQTGGGRSQGGDRPGRYCRPEGDGSRVGVVVASAVGGIATIQEIVTTLLNRGPRRVSPFSIPMIMSNGASGVISIDYGFRGPSLSVASACASGVDGIGMAWLMLKAGMIDVAIAGASEATITETGVAAFDRVGAMSRRDDPATTPQPFDLNRDGLVMGEGAGILVLERESHARQRGAEILAELAGYGSTADAFHITAPAEDGSGGAAAIRQALATAGVNPEEIDYINAHGTGTELNDVSETRAIKAALGEQAYKIPVSSTKSMTGHMMGATGALETIFCVQAVRTGCLPPTIHYQTPDPRCDLDYIPNQARQSKVEVA